jgi:hypothetical protein
MAEPIYCKENDKPSKKKHICGADIVSLIICASLVLVEYIYGIIYYSSIIIIFLFYAQHT